MAGCDSFSVDINHDLELQIEKIRLLIENSGGRFHGDTQAGIFSGRVSPFGAFQGTYKVNESVIAITIIQKPFSVPCRSIESKIRDFFR